MTGVPVVSWQEVETVLHKLGYTFSRQRGSHRIWSKPISPSISVPQHQTLKPGTPGN